MRSLQTLADALVDPDPRVAEVPALDRAGLAAQVAAYHVARGHGPDGAAAADAPEIDPATS